MQTYLIYRQEHHEMPISHNAILSLVYNFQEHGNVEIQYRSERL